MKPPGDEPAAALHGARTGRTAGCEDFTLSPGQIPYYDLSATMPPETTPEQRQSMLQSMLAASLRMSSHWETRDMRFVAVVVAPGGLKIRKLPDSTRRPHAVGFVRAAEEWKLAVQPNIPSEPSGMTIAQMAQALPRFFSRYPNIDQTGLDGLYDIRLSFPARAPE